jgi:Fe-S-cluster-containing dehydrogenase component
MEQIRAIAVDLDYCVGCYACEVACKQENNVPDGKRWTRKVPVGPHKVNGMLRMYFLSWNTDACNFCQHRLDEGKLPRCVENCPTNALNYYSNDTLLLDALSNGKRLQICKLAGPHKAFA